MNRDQKAALIDNSTLRLKASPFILVVEYKGIKVKEVNQFRRELEKNGMGYRVLKNTLVKRAFAGTGVEGLDGFMKGMTGIVYSGPDGIASARVLKDMLKTYPSIQIKAGYFDGSVIENEPVKVVAELPGREELLATLLSTIQAGPQQLVRLIAAPGQQLIQVLSNYAQKLEDAEKASS